MLPKDVPQVHAMLMKKLATFKLYIRFSAEELAHWVLPRAGVVDSFVVQSPDGNVTDFCSYYFLPSSILKHQKHTKLNAVYSFYNVATSVSLEQLMTDCLIKVGVSWLLSKCGWNMLGWRKTRSDVALAQLAPTLGPRLQDRCLQLLRLARQQ